MSLVSAVMVSYNTREATVAALDSLVANAGTALELVVVDNGSRDGSAAAVRAAHTSAVVIEAGGNLGFARGVNVGVAASRGSHVLLINPDTLTRPDAVAALLRFAEAHPEYGVYGGRTLRPDGSTDPSSCWGAPTLWSLLCFATGLSSVFRRSRVFDPESLGRWDRDTVQTVDVVTGCLLLTTRATWDALGGMDEKYFLYGEDADFSARARRMGLRPVIVPDAVIVHDVGGSTGAHGRKMSLVMAGKATVLRDHWGPSRRRAGLALLLAGTALRAALSALVRRPGSWSEVWRSRRDWTPGYPAAENLLFDDAVAKPVAS